MLIFGMIYHVRFMRQLRQLRTSMREQEFIHGETEFPVSLTLIAALTLLIIGIATVIYMAIQAGQLG